MVYNYATARRNRRQPPYRYGKRRNLFLDNNVVMSPMAQGAGGRMPISLRSRVGGGRTLRRRLNPTYIGMDDEYAHPTTEIIGGSDRLENSAAQSTRQYGETVTNGEVVTNRTLTFSPFVWPSAGTSVGDRLGSTIRVSGIKLCEQFDNPNPFPVTMHYIVVQPRSTDLTGVWTPNLDFFRNASSSVNRSANFVDTGADPLTNPYDFIYDCYSLNPSKWNILVHKKQVLAGLNDSVNWRWHTWKFSQYIPMKGKRFTFATETETQPTQPIFRFYWWQPLRKNDWDAAPDLTALSTTRNADAKIFFRNAMS